MPVWLTIVGLVATAVTTYYIAPSLNSQFEVEKSRSQYIMENMKILSDDTSKLFSYVTELSHYQRESAEYQKIHIELNKIFTRLQWKANEYEILFSDKSGNIVIHTYSTALHDLRLSIANNNTSEDNVMMLKHSKSLIIATKNVIALLSERADWAKSFRIF
jgi:hypothetical protein